MATSQISTVLTFGDGTSIPSANIPYANISNAPTKLSQFTNDLGNYGGFLVLANIDQTQNGGAWQGGACGLHFQVVGSTVSVIVDNCNCACNC